MINPLRRYRMKAGLSQEDLADKIGVCALTICRWERGKHLPQQRRWQAIRKKTGITYSAMVVAAEYREAAE